MKIQTFSVVVGGEACNAKCPYCVAGMTPSQPSDVQDVNWRNFHKASNFAKISGVATVMLTGKGEPTLYPKVVSEYLSSLKKWDFPFIEMQTNGILLEDGISEEILKSWYDLGMNTIAVSVAGLDAEKNRRLFMPYADKYIDLRCLVDRLHNVGFSVRLTSVLHKQGMSSIEDVEKFVDGCRAMGVEQTTLTPVNAPEKSKDDRISIWIASNVLQPDMLMQMEKWLQDNGNMISRLVGGGKVYDVNGQNVCWNTCLTKDANESEFRNLIFHQNGRLMYSWEFGGAVII